MIVAHLFVGRYFLHVVGITGRLVKKDEIMNRMLTVLWVVLMVALVACGSDRDDSTIDSSVELQVPTLMPRNIVVDCSDAAIENWADLMYPNVRDFASKAQSFASTASDTDESALQNSWNQLIVLRDNITIYTTPDCLERQHDQILTRLQAIIEEFQKFGTGRSTVADFQDGIDENVTALEDQLNRLNAFMTELYNNN